MASETSTLPPAASPSLLVIWRHQFSNCRETTLCVSSSIGQEVLEAMSWLHICAFLMIQWPTTCLHSERMLGIWHFLFQLSLCKSIVIQVRNNFAYTCRRKAIFLQPVFFASLLHWNWLGTWKIACYACRILLCRKVFKNRNSLDFWRCWSNPLMTQTNSFSESEVLHFSRYVLKMLQLFFLCPLLSCCIIETFTFLNKIPFYSCASGSNFICKIQDLKEIWVKSYVVLK